MRLERFEFFDQNFVQIRVKIDPVAQNVYQFFYLLHQELRAYYFQIKP